MAFANDCLDTLGVCPERIKVVRAGQHSTDDVTLEVYDILKNEPVDLITRFGLSPSSSSSSMSSSSSSSSSWSPTPDHEDGIQIILKDRPDNICYITTDGYIKTEEEGHAGILHIPVDTVLSAKSGVWCGMVLVWKSHQIVFQYPFYFEITPNLRIYNPSGGPITFYEVRLAVRDVCPELNFLIDRVDFRDEEIAWAIRRPIDYWNEVPPPVTQYTTVDFPYRYHWMEAVIGELLRLVATWMRRNDLDYSAAGLTVADTKKWPDYLQMGEQRLGEFKNWVKNKKIEINIEGAYGTLTGYRNAPYR